MQPKGLNSKFVLAELRKMQKLDQKYQTGRILGSMCTKPHPIAKKAYQMFFESNLGDGGLFPGSKHVEEEVIAQLSSLLHGTNTAGFLVSGGTEANLTALYAAKKKANKASPEVILGESAHFSLHKVCSMLGLKAVYAPLNKFFRIDPIQVEDLINKNTIAIVGTAGTAELGTVDPIDQLSLIASKNEIWLHVDAAFGGLVIPFLEGNMQTFDFCLKGVSSITVDPHKMGMAAIPAGSILFREKQMLNLIETKTPYLTENIQYTFVGTKPGAAAASALAVFNLLGVEGFRDVVRNCIENTRRLTVGLKGLGYEILVEPTLNMVAFRVQNTKMAAQKLWRMGWFVSYVPRYDCLRIVVMPHVKSKHVTSFLRALKTTEKVR